MSYEKEIKKTIEMLNDKIDVSTSMLSEYSRRNRELRSFNNDIQSRLRRVEKENAQLVRTMQMMLKIINICEKSIDNFLDSKLEENHKRAELKEGE